uniref:hypothetical protein n=1 Tax=Pyrococcus sp. JT1 TaxID=165215 RepID=UPI00146D21B0|nr:hypothetical protein [Pyrococcus sp. JT1]
MPRPVKHVYKFEIGGLPVTLRLDTKKGRWLVHFGDNEVANMSRKEGWAVLSFIELLTAAGTAHKIEE